MRRWLLGVVAAAVLLTLGCTKAPATVAPNLSPGAPDVGYLRVVVRSGEQGENPPIPDAEIVIQETGVQARTDPSGNSQSLRLAALMQHPVMAGHNIGYYTIVVTKPGFQRHIHHGFVHGGATEENPTTLDVYLIPGEGQVEASDSLVGGRSAPQTPGPVK